MRWFRFDLRKLWRRLLGRKSVQDDLSLEPAPPQPQPGSGADAEVPEGSPPPEESPVTEPPSSKEIAPACQVVWDGEPLADPSGFWVEAARASAVVYLSRERTGTLTSLLVVVVGSAGIERHRFRVQGENLSIRSIVREAVDVFPAGSGDLSGVLPLVDGSGIACVIAVAPSIPREWFHDLKRFIRSRKIPALTPKDVARDFPALWERIHWPALKSGPRVQATCILSYPRTAWGTSVPGTLALETEGAGLTRTFRLKRDVSSEQSFECDLIVRDDTRAMPSTSVIQGRPTGLDTTPGGWLALALAACPATGSARCVLSREPRERDGRAGPAQARPVSPGVFWPVERGDATNPAPDASEPVPISVCLALDSSSASATWKALAPLILRLIALGRLGFLQVVRSLPAERVQRMCGWSPNDLLIEPGRLRDDASLRDDPGAIRTTGLGEALREALIRGPSGRPDGRAVGLVIAHDDYNPGRDPALQSAVTRWSWSIRMRQKLGGHVCLMAYRIASRDEGARGPLRDALDHLVLLGGQSRSVENLVPNWGPRLATDREALDAEVRAILAVADRAPATHQPRVPAVDETARPAWLKLHSNGG